MLPWMMQTWTRQCKRMRLWRQERANSALTRIFPTVAVRSDRKSYKFLFYSGCTLAIHRLNRPHIKTFFALSD